MAAVTYGVGGLGGNEPRTAHSYLPEFENELKKDGRLSVDDFAKRLGKFFQDQWKKSMPKNAVGDMIFLIGGYNEGEPYGQVYEVKVPSDIKPKEHNPNTFGLAWGGQSSITARVLNAVQPDVVDFIKNKLKLDDKITQEIYDEIRANYGLKIPYQFLPLQDCVDLSILLVRTTSQLMQYITDIRGVGGAIDVATITRVQGFCNVQAKQISGDF